LDCVTDHRPVLHFEVGPAGCRVKAPCALPTRQVGSNSGGHAIVLIPVSPYRWHDRLSLGRRHVVKVLDLNDYVVDLVCVVHLSKVGHVGQISKAMACAKAHIKVV